MKKTFVWFACFVMVLRFGVSQANAAGFGFYGSAGSGSGESSFDGGPGVDIDTTHQGAGFVFDTAVASDRAFNYHLNLGYDKFTREFTTSGSETEFSGLLISNAFGIGIVRTEGFRMWLGPEIRLAWPSGSNTVYDYDLFGLGFGPALGMNFNLPGALTLGIKAGYQMMNYAGEATEKSTGIWHDIDIEENMVYVNFSLMFRSGRDRF